VITVGMKGRLYTTGDLADRLGVGRQRAYVLSRMKDFPEPYEEWANGLTVWSATDVEEWIKTSRYAAEANGD
jgi:predicted DNA-binding transcriptional regulator AlpA